jgi:hypothetical protein
MADHRNRLFSEENILAIFIAVLLYWIFSLWLIFHTIFLIGQTSLLILSVAWVIITVGLVFYYLKKGYPLNKLKLSLIVAVLSMVIFFSSFIYASFLTIDSKENASYSYSVSVLGLTGLKSPGGFEMILPLPMADGVPIIDDKSLSSRVSDIWSIHMIDTIDGKMLRFHTGNENLKDINEIFFITRSPEINRKSLSDSILLYPVDGLKINDSLDIGPNMGIYERYDYDTKAVITHNISGYNTGGRKIKVSLLLEAYGGRFYDHKGNDYVIRVSDSWPLEKQGIKPLIADIVLQVDRKAVIL